MEKTLGILTSDNFALYFPRFILCVPSSFLNDFLWFGGRGLVSGVGVLVDRVWECGAGPLGFLCSCSQYRHDSMILTSLIRTFVD